MRPNVSRLILTCLALLALGWAQVFGMMRGYVCDCGGQVEITAFDHCHGPHGVACHEGQDASHHDEDHPNSEDSHEHSPFKEPVQAQKQFSPVLQGFVPVLAVVATLEALTPLISLQQNHLPSQPPNLDDGGGGRSWPQVLTRTIALVI